MTEATHEVIQSSAGVRIVLHHLGGPGGNAVTPMFLFYHATGLHGRVCEPWRRC